MWRSAVRADANRDASDSAIKQRERDYRDHGHRALGTMKYLLPFILLMLCGCRALDKKIVQMSAAPVPSPLFSMENRSELITVPEVVTLVLDANDQSLLAVNYSPRMDPTKFEWRAEVSPDLRRWFYFYQFENSPTIEFPRFQPNTFVRLVGVPWPPSE
jgi:hypothetical protein